MKHWTRTLFLSLALASTAFAVGDDFKRERKPGDTRKDALEGKVAPAISVDSWMNAGEKPLDLRALRGKVVVLDFWGTW
jgi:hypothetical protein